MAEKHDGLMEGPKHISEFEQLQSKAADGHVAVMKNSLALLFVAAACLRTGLVFAEEDSGNDRATCEAVWKASGGENWPQVKTIDFTFVVEKDGKTVSAEHHWDVAAQTDQVKWKGKDVTVNLADPAAD